MASRYAFVKVAVVAVVAAVALTGCISGNGYSDLDREPTSEDAPPAGMPDYVWDDIDEDTVRFVGKTGDSRLFLARGTQTPVCLLIYTDDTSWASGCGTGLTTGGTRAEIVTDFAPDLDGWTRVGRNVLVKD